MRHGAPGYLVTSTLEALSVLCFDLINICLGSFCGTAALQSLPLPHFRPIGQEFGPLCVKAKQGVCSGKPRSYQTVGTILNGSYQAPEFADMNGDGRLDLITVHTGNNTVMIFYNQGYGTDRLPVFEAAASVIVPSNRTIRAVHPMVTHAGENVLRLWLARPSTDFFVTCEACVSGE